MFVFLCLLCGVHYAKKKIFPSDPDRTVVQIRRLLIVVRLRRGCRVLPGCTKVYLGLHNTLHSGVLLQESGESDW